MAFPTTPILDTFTGTENPIATGWSGPLYFGETELRKGSGVLFGGAGNSYWDISIFGPNCEAYFTITTLPGDTFTLSVYARIQGPNTTGMDGYRVKYRFNAGGTDLIFIDRIDDRIATTLGGSINQDFAVGDSIGIQCIGNQVSAWRKPSGGSWTLIGTRTDSTYSSPGYIGVELADGTCQADDFGGGSIPLSNTFETGVADETTITTANSDDGPAGNAFDAVTITGSATLKYDNDRPSGRGGNSSLRFAANSTDTAYVTWNSTSLPASYFQYGRLYVYLTAVPTPSELWLLNFFSGASPIGVVMVDTSGKLLLYDSIGNSLQSTNTVPLNTWVRIEWMLSCFSPGGTLEAKMFYGDSVNAIETQTFSNAVIPGKIEEVDFGQYSAASTGLTFWMKDIEVRTDRYPGPLTRQGGSSDSYVRTVLADRPVAYYRMEEASGLPQDSSGNGNHTTVSSGTATYAQSGAITSGNSILWPSSFDVYFTAPDHSTLDCGDVVTIELWYRPVYTGAGQLVLIAKGNGAYGMSVVNNRMRLENDGNSGLVRSNFDLTDTNRWYHCVGVKNGATRKMYVDGVDVSDLVTPSTLVNTTNVLFLGSDTITPNCYLDEVAIYGTELSAARVQEHYRMGLQARGIGRIS